MLGAIGGKRLAISVCSFLRGLDPLTVRAHVRPASPIQVALALHPVVEHEACQSPPPRQVPGIEGRSVKLQRAWCIRKMHARK